MARTKADIARMRDKRNIRGLTKALKDDEFLIRRAATIAIGEIGGKRAVKPLCTVLKDEHAAVREQAIDALLTITKKIGADTVLDNLLKALKDDSSKAREAAAVALGTISDVRAAEPLYAALKDDTSNVRNAAAVALGKIGDTRAVEPLCTALKDEDPQWRKEAAQLLGEIRDTSAVGPLIVALDDRSRWVRKAAGLALKSLGWKPENSDRSEAAAIYWIANGKCEHCVPVGQSAVNHLIDVLNDKLIGASAAIALGEIGERSALQELSRHLGDRESAIRVEVAEAVVKIGGPFAASILILGLQTNQEIKERYTEAEKAQGKARGDWDKAREELMSTSGGLSDRLTDYNEIRATAHLHTSERITELRAKRLGMALKVDEIAAKALGEMGDEKAVPHLIEVLEHERYEIGSSWSKARAAAAMALGKLGDGRAEKPLKRARRDKREEVREAAQKALILLEEGRSG